MKRQHIEVITHWREDNQFYEIDAAGGTETYSLSPAANYPLSEFATGTYRSAWGRLVSGFVWVADFIDRHYGLREGEVLTYTNAAGSTTKVVVIPSYSQQEGLIFDIPTVGRYKLAIIKKGKP